MAPALPVEVIQNILVLSLPERGPFESFQYQRHDLLCVYALVCRAWRTWAQTELYRYVSLHGDAAVTRWKQAGAHLLDRVDSLDARGQDIKAPMWELAEVLKLCTTLTHLSVTDVELSAHMLASAQRKLTPCWSSSGTLTLSSMPDVTKLELCHVELDLTYSPSSFLFPHLHHLSLLEMAPQSLHGWAAFLNPTSLPHLRSFKYADGGNWRNYQGRDETLAAQLAAFGPQLTVLTLSTSLFGFPRALEPHLPSLTSLLSLSFSIEYTHDGNSLLEAVVGTLPSPLEHLDLRQMSSKYGGNCEAAGLHEVVTTLHIALEKDASLAAQTLNRLGLPDRFFICEECDELLRDVERGLDYLQGRLKMDRPLMSRKRLARGQGPHLKARCSDLEGWR